MILEKYFKENTHHRYQVKFNDHDLGYDLKSLKALAPKTILFVGHVTPYIYAHFISFCCSEKVTGTPPTTTTSTTCRRGVMESVGTGCTTMSMSTSAREPPSQARSRSSS